MGDNLMHVPESTGAWQESAGTWQKSSYSHQETACVEFRRAADGIRVRDSKHLDSSTIHTGTAEWAAFLAGIKTGEFDR